MVLDYYTIRVLQYQIIIVLDYYNIRVLQY
jgi:hypothetical protein